MRLRFTPEALNELDQVLADIAAQSPNGVHRVRGRIHSMLDLLVRYPNSGQMTDLDGLRRLVATPYPYLIFYQVEDDAIVVIGVRHGARNPSSMPGAD